MEESRRVISLIDLKGVQPREQIFFTATIGKSIGALPERVSIFAWAKDEPLWGSKSIAPGFSPGYQMRIESNPGGVEPLPMPGARPLTRRINPPGAARQ